MSLRARLYAFAFVDELGPLITLYTLWFADHGVSAGAISAVFVLWALVGLVLEVPSGALADRMDRRHLVAFAMGLRAVGFVVWLAWPTVWGLAIGAVLWAVHSALCSGAWEALVYDELDLLDERSDYARTMARVGQASNSGVFVGIVLATTLLGAGTSLAVLGWVTVGLHFVSMVAVLTLPRVPRHSLDDQPTSVWVAYWHTLRDGVRDVARVPPTARLVVAASVLGGFFLLDEYLPLLGRVRGAPEPLIPLLVLAVWAGVLLGGEVAARNTRLSPPVLGTLLGASAILGVFAVFAGPWWLLPLLGLCVGTQNLTWVLADARLQARLPDATRATATSVRELLSNTVSMVALGGIGLLSVGEDPTWGVGLLLVGLVVTAGVVTAWVPRSAASPSPGADRG